MFALFPSRMVAFVAFGFPVHWYGLLYLAAFLIGLFLLPRLQYRRSLQMTKDEWMTFASYCVVGVIVGGRLGYVLFYDLPYFLAQPWKVFAVWEGGMASHGGFIGVILAVWLYARREHKDFWAIADVLVIPAAIGLACGRVGNFINQELYGTVTSLPLAISIPGVEGLRHPTQLYGVFKDLLIALLCYVHLRRPVLTPGRTASLFLILYGIGRTIVEFFREQTVPPFHLLGMTITRGQALTIPLFLAGVILWYARRPKLQTSVSEA